MNRNPAGPVKPAAHQEPHRGRSGRGGAPSASGGGLATAVDTMRMDLLVSLVLGVVVLVVLAAWIMSASGIGEQFFNPVLGVLGAPFIWLSRRMNVVRRKRNVKRLPSDVPAPPSVP